MRRALALAQRGRGQVAPNPLVGAVVVNDGTVVGEGWHALYGGPHAEVAALTAAGDRARGATVYVTLEPCNHTGKTPPCSQALINAGVARVVYAAADPNPVAAGGAQLLAEHGIQIVAGVLRDAAHEQNAPFFYHARGATRPWVTLKLALSLDGAIADHTRQPGWITGRAARQAVHKLRASADAVAVGIGTALADDPQLTVRSGKLPRTAPARVVFDRRARLPVNSKLVQTVRETPVIAVVHHEAQNEAESARRTALQSHGVTLMPAQSLTHALDLLHTAGIHHLLVEGGAGLASELLGTNLVDRLVIFQGSVILGGGALPAFAALPPQTVAEAKRWHVVSRRAFGNDLMTIYAVSES